MGTSIDLFRRLLNDDWHVYVPEIEQRLKQELQGSKGFLKVVRSNLSIERSQAFDARERSFEKVSLDELDWAVNEFATYMLLYNSSIDVGIQYDLLKTMNEYPELRNFPFLKDACEFVFNPANPMDSIRRLSAVILKIANQSLSQASKSNAGNAGERIVRAMLLSVGLKRNQHYREQYKSKTGSDTDFAFPYVKDYNDSQLEVLVAVQMSTNDRARLASSELKHGVVCYVVTGNGLDASSKTLGAIGSQIIETYHQSNIRLVCYEPEVRNEIRRLENKLTDNFNESDDRRLSYFKSHAISFQQFASSMQRFRGITARA